MVKPSNWADSSASSPETMEEGELDKSSKETNDEPAIEDVEIPDEPAIENIENAQGEKRSLDEVSTPNKTKTSTQAKKIKEGSGHNIPEVVAHIWIMGKIYRVLRESGIVNEKTLTGTPFTRKDLHVKVKTVTAETPKQTFIPLKKNISSFWDNIIEDTEDMDSSSQEDNPTSKREVRITREIPTPGKSFLEQIPETILEKEKNLSDLMTLIKLTEEMDTERENRGYSDADYKRKNIHYLNLYLTRKMAAIYAKVTGSFDTVTPFFTYSDFKLTKHLEVKPNIFGLADPDETLLRTAFETEEKALKRRMLEYLMESLECNKYISGNEQPFVKENPGQAAPQTSKPAKRRYQQRGGYRRDSY